MMPSAKKGQRTETDRDRVLEDPLFLVVVGSRPGRSHHWHALLLLVVASWRASKHHRMERGGLGRSAVRVEESEGGRSDRPGEGPAGVLRPCLEP